MPSWYVRIRTSVQVSRLILEEWDIAAISEHPTAPLILSYNG